MIFYSNFLFFLTLLFIYYILQTMVIRKMMVKKFVDATLQQQPENKQSFSRMWRMGYRYDAKISAIILVAPFVIGSILAIFSLEKTVATLFSLYIFIVSLLFTGINIGNYFYFKTYKSYYNIFMFGLVEDDTKAVLNNIYEDYPIIKLTGLTFCLAILPTYSCYYFLIDQPLLAFHSIFLSVYVLVTLIYLAYAARGYFFTHPLAKMHAQVSSLSIINQMVPNGIIAMKWAFEDRKRDIKFAPVNMDEGEQLITTFQPFTPIPSQPTNLIQSFFTAKTAKNPFLEQHPPHVVMALMESFGNNFLHFDHPETNDLLGKLRPYFQQDYLFKRFTSDYNGTAPSLASLYFHSPIQNISQSVAQNVSLKQTPFHLYRSKGYKTIFITAGNIMWRNLANYLPLQGVDELYDQNTIIDNFPEAKDSLSYWGVADEYAFKLAEKLLTQSTQPLFINILTMTNHPPFKAPDHYQPYPVNPEVLTGKILAKDLQEQKNILQAFQYAANALGEFIQSIENSDLVNNTIIAASGDHHMRAMENHFPIDLFLDKTVPFFVHLPQQLKQQLEIDFQPARLGSHKDIMPTLYSLSLSNCEYWHLGGRNLLSNQADKNFNFAFNETVIATSNAVYDIHTENIIKYQWDLQTGETGQIAEISDDEVKQIKAYQQLLYWQINYHVAGASPQPSSC
ncbi:sulfatase [Gallibacterium genomosp. 3]|uniref:Sulfatase n=1 Tax=Gallibacterium genomosp. 3 TaxID=505345 RepID=A0A1A7NQH1_9PAST|nr:alkaline phosphatase family protein [Gallibacterium genomosp. 3]OBW92452.1 sulfatase [Gallibacterium genomosp. 3]